MIQRFVNIVAESYKGGLYSLHRLDVAKHLFYRSRDEAQVMPLQSEAQAGTATASDKPQLMEMLEQLPCPTAEWQGPKYVFFGLVSPRKNVCRIVCTDEADGALLYNPDTNNTDFLPCPKGFKGPVAASVSIPGAKEDDLYVMHHGLDLKPRFSVLRFGPLNRGSYWESWHWWSLPLPPFVHCPQYKPTLISSYTVVDGGRSFCVSSAAEGTGGTCSFDTVSCEWSHTSDWVLPFHGKAEYVPDLKLWLGFSRCRPHHLCATSGLSDTLMDQQQPISPIVVWEDHTPGEWMVTSLNLFSLGSGRFATAKVFKAVHNTGESGFSSDQDKIGNEFLVLTGLELGRRGNCDDNRQALEMVKHKSICYMCANNTIRYVI